MNKPETDVTLIQSPALPGMPVPPPMVIARPRAPLEWRKDDEINWMAVMGILLAIAASVVLLASLVLQ